MQCCSRLLAYFDGMSCIVFVSYVLAKINEGLLLYQVLVVFLLLHPYLHIIRTDFYIILLLLLGNISPIDEKSRQPINLSYDNVKTVIHYFVLKVRKQQMNKTSVECPACTATIKLTSNNNNNTCIICYFCKYEICYQCLETGYRGHKCHEEIPEDLDEHFMFCLLCTKIAGIINCINQESEREDSNVKYYSQYTLLRRLELIIGKRFFMKSQMEDFWNLADQNLLRMFGFLFDHLIKRTNTEIGKKLESLSKKPVVYLRFNRLLVAEISKTCLFYPPKHGLTFPFDKEKLLAHINLVITIFNNKQRDFIESTKYMQKSWNWETEA